MTKIYALITHYERSAPELEFFSELPTMDFTLYADTAEFQDRPTRHDLYEGYLDGGDSMPISILECYTCRTRRAVTKTRVDNHPYDPSEVYTLTCGHDVLAGA